LLLERVHPEDRDLVRSALESARRGHDQLRFEVRVTRLDGVERVIRARGEAIVPPQRGPIKVAGTFQDISEEAEEHSARDLLSYVVQSTGDAIVTKAPDGTRRSTCWARSATPARLTAKGRTGSPG
jgi:PAS domain-containing protein